MYCQKREGAPRLKGECRQPGVTQACDLYFATNDLVKSPPELRSSAEQALDAQKRCEQHRSGCPSFSAGTTSFPGSDGSSAAELQRGLTSHSPEVLRLTSRPRRNEGAHQHSHILCTSFCFGQKSPFFGIAWEKTTSLSAWRKGCKASSSPRADWATHSLQGHVLDLSASKASLWRPTQAENPRDQAVLGMILHIQTQGVVKSQLSCLAPVFPNFRRGL